jgi:hypothetical protein
MSQFNPWVVEWSDYQQCFHVCELDEALKNNAIAFLTNQPLQFTILAVVRNVDEANKAVKIFEEARSEQTNSMFNS